MGILNDAYESNNIDVNVIGDAATEAEVFLLALRNECASDEEFASILESAGTEMALYDVIPDADIAIEAAKKIVVHDWKTSNFNRIAHRTAIRMAKVNNDTLYAKYSKHRAQFLADREAIFKKYEAKARSQARKIIMNARQKAANMDSTTGKSITQKMDQQIAKIEASNTKK